MNYYRFAILNFMIVPGYFDASSKDKIHFELDILRGT